MLYFFVSKIGVIYNIIMMPLVSNYYEGNIMANYLYTQTTFFLLYFFFFILRKIYFGLMKINHDGLLNKRMARVLYFKNL